MEGDGWVVGRRAIESDAAQHIGTKKSSPTNSSAYPLPLLILQELCMVNKIKKSISVVFLFPGLGLICIVVR